MLNHKDKAQVQLSTLYHTELTIIYGHKRHIDQNEKLGMYGVTHVSAIDGHSHMIVSWTTTPVKNNLIIYSEVFK